MLTRVVLASALLAGVLVQDARAEDTPSVLALVDRVYPVADLIDAHGCYLVPPGKLFADARPQPPWEARANVLMKLVVNVVAPTTWRHHHGLGTIDYFPLGMALVVWQTPEVHERIAEFLAGLRRMNDLEVVVETRLLSLSDAVFAQLCEQLCLQPKETDLDQTPPDAAAPTSTRTLLNDLQIFQLFEMIQGDHRSQVMQAPKLTLFDGQTANLEIVDYQYFVTNAQVVQNGGSVVFVPQNQAVPVGMQMQVKAVVAADLRSIRLDLKMRCTDVAATVPLLPVECFISPYFHNGDGTYGEPTLFTQFVQQPKIRRLNLDESVHAPYNGTALLAGWKRTRQLPSELGGLLADLLGPNFDGLRHRDETEHLVLLVTPRIIVSEEEAWQGTGVDSPARAADVLDLFAELYADQPPGSIFAADDEIFGVFDRMREAGSCGQLFKVQ